MKYVYRAYNCFTTQELYFSKHPSKKDFINHINWHENNYEEDEWEIKKLDLMNNK